MEGRMLKPSGPGTASCTAGELGGGGVKGGEKRGGKEGGADDL